VSGIESSVKVFPFRPWLLVVALILMVPLYYWGEWFKSAPDVARMAVAAIALGFFFGAWGPKSLFLVLMSVVAFGYLLRPLGLVVATIVLCLGSAYAGHEFKLKEQAILAVGLSIFVVWTFVHGLGLSMNVWPGFLE
jgi:hypothetical protein